MRPIIRIALLWPAAFVIGLFAVMQVASTGAAPAWLDYVNQIRAVSDLPPLTENTSWNSGCVLHSRYVVKNNVLTHGEDPSNEWYTTEGNACGNAADVMSSSSVSATDNSAVDLWMQGPFHAVGIIDPKLVTTGFGSYREADGGIQMSAALDVIRGRTGSVSAGTFPIYWPGDGSVTHLYRYSGGESPNPLTSCPGYTTPTGLPLILQIGSGSLTPSVTAHTFMQGTTSLPHCIFDQTNYTNPDSGSQSTGRSVLNSRDAIVLIPQAPLTAGLTYTASITTNGQTYTWSFTISGAGVTTAPAPSSSSTPTATASPTASPTQAPTASPTKTPSPTPAPTASPTKTPSPPPTQPPSPTPTHTPSPTPTATSTAAQSETPPPTTPAVETSTPTGTVSVTPTPTDVPSLSPPPGPTDTPEPTAQAGDSNCDGERNQMDVIWVLYQLAGIGSPAACLGNGSSDLNCNYTLEAGDLIQLLRLINGLGYTACG